MLKTLVIAVVLLGAILLLASFFGQTVSRFMGETESHTPLKTENTPGPAWERNIYSTNPHYRSPFVPQASGYQAHGYNCNGCASGMSADVGRRDYNPGGGRVGRAEAEPYGLMTQDGTRVRDRKDFHAVNPFGRVTDMQFPSRSKAQVMETIQR